MSFNDFAIVSVRIRFMDISKDEAVNSLKKADLRKKMVKILMK